MLTKFGVNYLFLLEEYEFIYSLFSPENDIKKKIAGFLLVVANECKLEVVRHVYVSLDFVYVVINMIYQNQNELIGQVCLHIRGICYSDKAPQCNRMTATGQDTDNKRTIYKYTNRQ